MKHALKVIGNVPSFFLGVQINVMLICVEMTQIGQDSLRIAGTTHAIRLLPLNCGTDDVRDFLPTLMSIPFTIRFLPKYIEASSLLFPEAIHKFPFHQQHHWFARHPAIADI